MSLEVGLGAGDEEPSGIIEACQTLEVEIAAIHDIEGAGFTIAPFKAFRSRLSKIVSSRIQTVLLRGPISAKSRVETRTFLGVYDEVAQNFGTTGAHRGRSQCPL
jgi:hypothetical protein